MGDVLFLFEEERFCSLFLVIAPLDECLALAYLSRVDSFIKAELEKDPCKPKPLWYVFLMPGCTFG